MVNKSAKRYRRIILAGMVLLVATAGLFIFSPYGYIPGYPYKLIATEITIAAPAHIVFKYLGNSANAGKWSTFVDHIVPLNPEKYEDGKPGFTRRCFRYSSRTGTQWDELITEVVPDKKRQLLIYNMKEFPVKADGLATEQLYEGTDPGTTRLTFTLFFKDDNPTTLEIVKMYVAAYRINSIFKANLKNIRTKVEQQYQSGLAQPVSQQHQ